MHAGRIIPGVVLVAAAAAIAIWLTRTSARPVPRVNPEQQRRLAEKLNPPLPPVPTAADAPRADGKLERADVPAASLPGEWPQFRGPQRDGVCRDEVPLAEKLTDPPKVIWARDVGEGHAGPTILGGRVFLVDYDVAREANVIRCMSLADGRDIWSYAYGAKVKREHGMSRTVAAVTKDYLVAMGPRCGVTCLNTADGSPRWHIDLPSRCGTAVPKWNAGQCPLIDRGRAILAPGGNALMLAVDCQSGKVVWHTPNPNRWKMTHSSITPVDLAGRRMYVYCANRGAFGVDAETGKRLWTLGEWKVRMANVPAPVVVPPDRILLSGDYDAGAILVKLIPRDGAIVPEVVLRKPYEEFSTRHHTPIFHGGLLYSVRQDQQMACMDLTGRVLWASGAEHRFNYGPFLIAGKIIYAMNDAGVLTLVRAGGEAFDVLSSVQAVTHEKDGRQVPGHDAWAPMALVAGRLILRDMTRMVCLDVRAEK